MNNRAQIRIWVIPPLLALAVFCFYGFLAAGEPGNAPAWRIAYGVGIALCLIGCVVAWVMSGQRPEK